MVVLHDFNGLIDYFKRRIVCFKSKARHYMLKSILPTALMTFFVLTTISGCSTIKKDDKPKVVDLKILTSKHTNPDEENAPSPLLVDMYEIKNSTDFLMLDYLDFPNILEDSSAISDDKDRRGIEAPKYSWILQPNNFLVEEIAVSETIEYLGVLAHYQNIQESDWRFVFKKQKPKSSTDYYLYLYVDSNTIKQLSKDEMNQKLKEYAKSNPNDSRFTKSGRLKQQKKDYSKGVFIQDMTPTLPKDAQKITLKIQENK